MPSTLENIDLSLNDWVNETLNIFTTTNDGFRKVPVVWGQAERSFMVKEFKERRDSEGTLILPLISIIRGPAKKDLSKKGYFGVNLFPENDTKGRTLTIARQLQPEKTKEFVNNDNERIYGHENYRSRKEQVAVYEYLSVPYPTYLDISYEIELRSEYLQQMNDMVAPFMAKTGGIDSFMLKKNGHKYEAFIQGDFDNGNNSATLADKERGFTTKVVIKVLGYIQGTDVNDNQPKVVIRESAAKFRIQRERVVLGDKPWLKTGILKS